MVKLLLATMKDICKNPLHRYRMSRPIPTTRVFIFISSNFLNRDNNSCIIIMSLGKLKCGHVMKNDIPNIASRFTSVNQIFLLGI